MPAEFILPPYKVSTLLSRLCLPWTSQQGRRPHVPKQLLLLTPSASSPSPLFSVNTAAIHLSAWSEA